MPYSLKDKLVVGITSRALFDLSADIADAWTGARRIAVADHPDEDALLTALKALDRTPVPP